MKKENMPGPDGGPGGCGVDAGGPSCANVGEPLDGGTGECGRNRPSGPTIKNEGSGRSPHGTPDGVCALELPESGAVWGGGGSGDDVEAESD